MVHPDLHADLPERRLPLGRAVVDLRPQRVQGDAAFPVPLAPRHLGPAEAAGALDPNAESPRPHRRLHRPAHGPTERHPAGELLGHTLREELRVGLGTGHRGRLVHVLDLHVGPVPGDPLDVLADPLHLRALPADDDARTGRPDEHLDLIPPPLDVDRGDAGPRQLSADVLADLDVLMQRVRVFLLVRIPVRLPGVDDPQPEPVRVDLVSHPYVRSCSATTGSSIVWTTSEMCEVRLRMRVARP